MATELKPLSHTAWTAVSSAITGTMENGTTAMVLYVTAATLPPATQQQGHQLRQGELMSWKFDPAQTIYARTLNEASGHLLVTEG